MKITRKQLRMLIESELKTILSEDSEGTPKRNVAKCVAAAEKELGKKLTGEERKRHEEACRLDDVVSWYDDEKETWAGETAIKEGTATEDMPAEWQQILGNILD